jgi:hypothetical protein
MATQKLFVSAVVAVIVVGGHGVAVVVVVLVMVAFGCVIRCHESDGPSWWYARSKYVLV